MEVFIDLRVGMMREAVPRSGTASLTMEILFVNFMGFEAYCLIEDAFGLFYYFFLFLVTGRGRRIIKVILIYLGG